MDLDEIEALTLEYLDDPFKRRWIDATLIRLINAGMDDVKRFIEDVNETFFQKQTGSTWATDHGSTTTTHSVAASDDVVEKTLPVDFSKLITVENISESPPLPLYRVKYSSRHPDASYDDRFLPDGLKSPNGYYIRGNVIGFVEPDAFNVRLTYIKTLPRLATATGTGRPEIPEDYHDLICLQAAKRGFAIEGRRMPSDLSDLRIETMKSMQGFLEDRIVQAPTFVNVQE
jgi:hypothetical protein